MVQVSIIPARFSFYWKGEKVISQMNLIQLTNAGVFFLVGFRGKQIGKTSSSFSIDWLVLFIIISGRVRRRVMRRREERRVSRIFGRFPMEFLVAQVAEKTGQKRERERDERANDT